MPSLREIFGGKSPGEKPKKSKETTEASVIKPLQPINPIKPIDPPTIPHREAVFGKRNYQRRTFEIESTYTNVTLAGNSQPMKIFEHGVEKNFMLPAQLFTKPVGTAVIEVFLPNQTKAALVEVTSSEQGNLVAKVLSPEEILTAEIESTPVWRYQDVVAAFSKRQRGLKFISSRRKPS